jgi:tetratricopeptide (TPR) repeat protein
LREPPPAELRAAVLDPLITASFRAADQAAFVAVEDDVFAEWERNPSVRGRWAIQLTMLMAFNGRFEEAASLLKEAVDAAVDEGDVERAFQLQAQLSTVAAIVPSVPEVSIDVRPDQIDPDSPTGRLAAAMEARSVAVNGSARDVSAAGKRALGNEGSIFAEEPELIAAATTVMVLVGADEIEVARHGAERALAIARERGATGELVRARFLTGFVAWGCGDLVTAEADMRQAVDLAQLAGIMPLVLTYTGPLIEVLIERDELEAAEAGLRTIGMAEGPIPPSPLFGFVRMMRGHLYFERGELGRALEDFEALATYAEELGFGLGPIASMSPFAVRALIALGRPEEACELADELMPYAWRLGTSREYPASPGQKPRPSKASRRSSSWNPPLPFWRTPPGVSSAPTPWWNWALLCAAPAVAPTRGSHCGRHSSWRDSWVPRGSPSEPTRSWKPAARRSAATPRSASSR